MLLASAAAACGSEDGAGQSATESPDASLAFAETQFPPRAAVAAPDQPAYRESVRQRRLLQETCSYDSETASADCSERGLYTLEPPPANPDSSCVVGLAGGETPEFVLCSAPDGAESTFYVIEAQ